MILIGKKILIAEDEDFTRTVIETALRRAGATVFSAPDGAEALAIMSGTVHFDAVLLDLMMPKAHGLQVLKAIRTERTGQKRNTAVAILTSASDKQSVSLSMRLDVDAFLVKPINRAAMIERLEHLTYRDMRILKDAASYESIKVPGPEDITDPVERALIAPRIPRATAHRVDSTDLKPGMVIAEDLTTVDGDIVVPNGTTISDMLINVLVDLRRIVQLSPVAIR
jgi:CheY-like chemotaxis protein